jgi:hypothetical protein
LNGTTGIISGTPTTVGTSNFTVKATNSAGNQTKALSIVISPAAPPAVAPSITTTYLPDGTEGSYYSRTLAATGGTPIAWSIDSGSLPSGLTLNGSTGAITGTPSTSGTYYFTVRASNSAGDDTQALSIVISPSTPVTPGQTTYNVTFTLTTGDGAPATGAVITFNGVAYPSGQYVIRNIAPGTYAYTVVLDGYQSISGTVTVTTRSQTIALTLTARIADGIESPAAAPNAWANGGSLHVLTSRPSETVRIYTLAGHLYRQQTVTVGETVIPLSKGVYVVVVEGKTFKVMQH